MRDMGLVRLYLLYKAGTVSTSFKEETELLQIAKSVGDDLTEDEFVWLAEQVSSLAQERDQRTRDAMAFQQGTDSVDSYRVKAMANKEYQERLWELPSLVRQHEKPFVPPRLSDGNPIDIDKNAPEETEERLKALPYHQVKHDPRLRDAWHAAQAGKLATLLKHGELWKSYTDPKAMGEAVQGIKINPRSLPGPLRTMLALADAGIQKAEMSPLMKAKVSSLPTSRIYQFDPSKVVSELSDKSDGTGKIWQDHYIKSQGLDKIPTQTPIEKVFEQDGDSVKKWVAEIREHHEMQVRQMMVNSQLESYRPTAAADSKPVDIQGFRDSMVNQAAAKVSDNPGVVEQLVPPVGGGVMDSLQTILDGVGIADPTPIADGVNAAISLARAFRDPANAGTHLANAGTSAISMVPYIGDLAKVFKYGGKAAKAADGTTEAATATSGSGGMFAALAAAFGGGGSGGSDVGGNVPPGSPPGGGSGGNPGGIPIPGGMGTVAGAIALAVSAAVADVFHRFKSANKLMQPDQYTGNSFDSASSMAGKGMDTFNTAAPFGMKWGVLGWTLGLATRQLQGWIEWLKKVEDAGNKMIESNRNLANYSGTIASAFAQLDADRVRREIGKANSMAGQLKGLAANQSQFEAAKQDLFEPFEKLQVAIQSKLTWIGTQVIKGIDAIEFISETIDWWIGDDKGTGERSALEVAMQKHAPQVKDKLK